MTDTTRTFVTGGTGLIGRRLVELLLCRGHHVYALLRPGSAGSRRAVLERWRQVADRCHGEIEVVDGDVTASGLGLQPGSLDDIAFDHVHHVAGYYDLTGSEEQFQRVNVEGTRNVLEFLRARSFRGTLHYVSSVAVAGDFEGELPEDGLELGQKHPHPYLRSKYEAEALVRDASDLRFRIYRPAAVVGDSKTGEMDRVDGPYFLFGAVRKVRDALPRWFPLVGFEGTTINMVPVDFVAAAIDHIALAPGWDTKTFHIVDPAPPKFVETFNLVADAAAAPRITRTAKGKLLKLIPGGGQMLSQLGALRFLREQILDDIGIPSEILPAINRKVTYASRNLTAALEGSPVACPPQSEYIETLWDYYNRKLAPEGDRRGRYRRHFAGKTVVITGASSGIGAALARACAAAGAHVTVVARREDRLAEVTEEIRGAGGSADYRVADLSDMDECDGAIEAIHAARGHVDILYNNAGHSIRRETAASVERFHDFERTMAINFFGPLRLIRAVLPKMRAKGGGQIVNILSAGAHFPAPRFAAYTTSKAALSQLGDTLGAELLHENVHVTGVYLPFVRTPMMTATDAFKDNRSLTPEQAAELIMDGTVSRERHVVNTTTTRRYISNRIAPKTIGRIMNVIARVYSDDEGQHPEFNLDRTLAKKFFKGRIM